MATKKVLKPPKKAPAKAAAKATGRAAAAKLRPRTGVSAGWNEWLCTFAKGEHRYRDTSLETYMVDRNAAMGQRGTQRSPLLKDMKFSVQMFTAIANATNGDVRYLLCITRTA